MLWSTIKSRLARYRSDERGSAVVEGVIALPILLMALAACFEFFEVHRYQAAREKATFTVADMLSREQAPVNAVYIDNAKTLFDSISDDDGINQIRITVVTYFAGTDTYEVSWSEVRGTGSLPALTNATIAAERATLPVLRDGEEIVLVESESTYYALFTSIFKRGVKTDTRVFTSLRFAPQLCFVTCNS